MGGVVQDDRDRREAERCPQEPARHGRLAYPAPPCQDLRRVEPGPHNPPMEQRRAAAHELPLRPQDEVECRRCGVHCDKIVYPAACIDRACPFVYAYEEFGHTYIGCMQNVYEVEIDVELLRDAELRREGFGAVRSRRLPLPMCRVEVEETYRQRTDDLGCVDPEFSELPVGRPTFRVFAQLR